VYAGSDCVEPRRLGGRRVENGGKRWKTGGDHF